MPAAGEMSADGRRNEARYNESQAEGLQPVGDQLDSRVVDVVAHWGWLVPVLEDQPTDTRRLRETGTYYAAPIRHPTSST
jgi:hypothetical protein